MEICSNKHEEICFEGRHCPICEQIDDLNETIENLNNKIEELEAE